MLMLLLLQPFLLLLLMLLPVLVLLLLLVVVLSTSPNPKQVLKGGDALRWIFRKIRDDWGGVWEKIWK